MRYISLLPFALCALLLGFAECTEEDSQYIVSATGEQVYFGGNAFGDDKGSGNHSEDVVFAGEEHKDDEDDSACVDTHENCAFWASIDECEKNPGYMLTGCPKSCNTCPKKLKLIDGLTSEQVDEKQLLLDGIAKYGKPQEVEGSSQDKTMFVIRKTLDYMKNHIHAEKPTHNLDEETINACVNDHESCAFWATIGECENNPAYMVTKCAPSCLSCHKISFETR